MNRAPLIFAAMVLLSGCATQAQRQFEAIKTGKQAIGAQFNMCREAIYNSPEFSSLRIHLPLDSTGTTLQQLSDQSLAMPTEVQTILSVYPKFKECLQAVLNGVAQTEPSVAPILTAAYTKYEDDVLALAQRKISWGDFVRRGRDRSIETQAATQAAEQQIVSGLQREHHAEIEERRRAAEALAEWAQTQQIINAANRPVVTNCNASANLVSCVSQ
jgi:hypothetical protein